MLAACAGRKGGASTASSKSGQAGAPKYGGQLNVASAYDAPSYDPASSSNPNQTAQILGTTNTGLLAFKSGPDVKYTDIILEPALAQRLEAPDAQTYTFRLRPNLTFANQPPANGRAVTSADVQWTYSYVTRLDQFKSLRPSLKAGLFAGLERIETPDPSTVVMHFAQPFAPFQTYSASPFATILPHEIFDQDGDFAKRIAGTGAWQLDASASQRGSRQVFKKNPSYYVSGRPYIDQINRLVLPENTTVNTAFQTKQIDVLDYSGLTPATVDQMKKSAPGVVVYEYLDPIPDQFYLNATKPPLNDVRVRRAIALSVDRDELLRVLAGGKGDWALAGSIPGLFSSEETRKLLKPDPSQARQLLSEAGYANGIDLELMFPNDKYGDTGLTEYQLLQSQLQRGGIRLALKGIDQATEGNRKHANDFQLDYSSIPIQFDLDDYLYGLFHPASGHNYTKVNDPELTPLLDAQRRETDAEKRRQLWRQAVQRIADQVWAVGFLNLQRTNLWWPHLKNFAPNWG